jgi:DNA-binding NarL/FixJ family response regulator
MAAALRELRDPWGLGLAVATGLVNLALRVNPLKAVAAAVLVLAVKLAAGTLWPGRAPTRPPSVDATQGKLSPRELEVAMLIPAGLSNKEIARKLVPPTSERTVDNHVQHILNKLNFDSRAQIAAWVARQDSLKK